MSVIEASAIAQLYKKADKLTLEMIYLLIMREVALNRCDAEGDNHVSFYICFIHYNLAYIEQFQMFLRMDFYWYCGT
jgi:hypothetical protein